MENIQTSSVSGKGTDTKKQKREGSSRLAYIVFRVIRFLTKLFYPKTTFEGAENIPDGPAVIVGNHAQMNAPIACELYFPCRHKTWTAGEMMHRKEVPAYAFEDFWSHKPAYIKWFFKGLSHLIVPFSVSIFNNADCIGVYHDTRIMSTYRESVRLMNEGDRIVILPEHAKPYNNIICEFQERFVDIGRMYYRKYHEEISFVPMYVAPALHRIYLGKAVKFDSQAPAASERTRITKYLMDEITDMARSLPEHTVVPYPNIPKNDYPSNKEYDRDVTYA